MSSQAQEAVIEGLEVEVAGEQLLAERRAGLQVSRETAKIVAEAGRYGVVWLPVYAFVSSHTASLTAAVGVALILTTIWFVALRTAFSRAFRTRIALGPTIPAALGSAAGFVGVSAATLWVTQMHLGRLALAETALGVFILSAFWESVALQSVAAVQRVLIVGASDGGSELVEDVELSDGVPFELLGIIDDERETDTIAGAPLLGRIAELPLIVRETKPDLIVLTPAARAEGAFDLLLDSAGDGFKVVGLPEFYEHAFGRVPARTVTATWFMSVLHLYQRPYSRITKRLFDATVAAIGLVLTAPLFPLIALLVRRTPGAVIFKQTRLGEGGKHFTIYKFRTMRADAEVEGAAVWASERDPRITTVGRALRLTRLDELPQLWNVLRGDMSIVGPRPERPEFVDEIQEQLPFWQRRHLVKPGITGWAQVRRGYTSDTSSTGEKLAYDLWYLRHRSLVVDLAICARTFLTVATGDGAR